jgi:hypothetical protein
MSLAQAAASGGKESLNDIAGNQKRPFVLPRGATKLDVSAQIEGDSIAVSQQGGRSAIRQKRAGSSRAREALRFVAQWRRSAPIGVII